MRSGIAVLGVGGLAFGAQRLFGLPGLFMLLLAAILIAVLLGGYIWFLKHRRKKKAVGLGREIKQECATAPQGVTQAEMIARMDDLRKKFEEGMDTFRAAGKNIYDLPWCVMVGEPGSGKTEAIRHSNVGFPPGLHEELQGVGGTINMNWWFTNYAVILDTAGRMMFDNVEAATSGEWKEFLRLLARTRPNCPVNGMLLVIPAESLIKDTAEDIERKGAHIAQQFDIIQRALDVRFPVFVLITKCDLINGFREFFDDIADPQLQHQMLGWSNPDAIDKPFQPDQLNKHLDSMQQRLIARRMNLLGDFDADSNDEARLGRMDTLYDFPHSFSRVIPRLKRYLQIIFAAGEWSSKPLFFRGIYFTSSMREGAALDADLAEALEVPIDSLPDGRVWERDRAYFLRDVWVEKVFKEKGLVTRSSSAAKVHWRRKGLVLGAGFLSVALLALLTWFGVRSLQRSVGHERAYWEAAGNGWTRAEIGEYWMPLVYKDVDGSYAYGGLTPINVGHTKMTVGDYHMALEKRAAQAFRIPAVFQAADKVVRIMQDQKSLRRHRNHAHRVVYEAGVMRPLLDAVRMKMSREHPNTWSPEAQRALEELIKLDTARTNPVLLDRVPDLDALFAYAIGRDNESFAIYEQRHAGSLATAWASIYDKGLAWPPESVSGGTRLTDNMAVQAGLACFIKRCSESDTAKNLEAQLKKFADFETLLKATDAGPVQQFEDLEKRFVKKVAAVESTVDTADGFAAFRGVWATDFQQLTREMLSLRNRLSQLDKLYRGIVFIQEDSAERAYRRTLATAYNDIAACLKQLMLPAAPQSLDTLLDKAPVSLPVTLADDVEKEVGKALDALAVRKKRDEARAMNVASATIAYQTLRTRIAAFQNRCKIYGLANVELHQPAPEPDETTLAGTLEDIDQRSDETIRQINLRLDPEDSAADTAVDLANKVCALVNRGLTYDAMNYVLQHAPETGGDITRRVAAQADDFPPVRRPTIPLTDMNGGTFLAEFNPESAATVIEGWDRIGVTLEESRDHTLDTKRLQRLFDVGKKAYSEYADQFAEYWTETVVRELSVRSMAWPVARDEIERLRVATVQESLENFCQNMAEMFKKNKIVSKYGGGRQIKRVEGMAERGMLRGERTSFAIECESVIKNWIKLPEDTLEARRQLLELPAAVFARRYLILGAEREEDYVLQYWEDMSSALLQALASQVKKDIVVAIKERQISAGELLAKIQLSPDTSGKSVLAQGAMVGVPRIDDQIEVLRLEGLVYDLAKRMVEKLPTTVEGVEVMVAQRAEAIPPVACPTLALTALQGGVFEARYHPRAAAYIFKNWESLRASLADKGMRTRERANLKQTCATRQHAYDEYIRRFGAYWKSQIDGRTKPRTLSWSACQNLLKRGDSTSINSAFIELMKTLTEAFAIPADFQSKLSASTEWTEIAKLVASNQKTATDRTILKRCAAVWSNWGRLPENGYTAREVILILSPSTFMSQYQFPSAAGQINAVRRYWEDFALGLLRSLSEQAKLDARDSTKEYDAFARFPLAPPKPGLPALTAVEVAAAHKLLSRNFAGRMRSDGTSLGEGAITGDHEVDALISALRSVGMPASVLSWGSAAAEMVKALPSTATRPFRCKISVAPVARQKELLTQQGELFARTSVLPIWRIVSLSQSDHQLGRSSTTLRKTEPLGSVKYPGGKIRIDLWKYPSDETPDWHVVFPAPWASLYMLIANQAQMSDDDPAIWYVPIKLSDSRVGSTRILWLQCEFQSPLPPLKDWPPARR